MSRRSGKKFLSDSNPRKGDIGEEGNRSCVLNAIGHFNLGYDVFFIRYGATQPKLPETVRLVFLVHSGEPFCAADPLIGLRPLKEEMLIQNVGNGVKVIRSHETPKLEKNSS